MIFVKQYLLHLLNIFFLDTEFYTYILNQQKLSEIRNSFEKKCFLKEKLGILCLCPFTIHIKKGTYTWEHSLKFFHL